MPRQARVVTPGLPHHLIFRGNNRRRLFSYPRDYLAFIRFLGAARETTECQIWALTLMQNHGHLIVVAPNGDALSRMMQSALQRYAQRRNRQHDTSGKLFEERFKCIPIHSRAQLAATTAYVELNPERAGESPAVLYRWTTYRLHVGREDPTLSDLWTPSSWYLSLADTARGRARIYADWVMLARRSYVNAVEVTPDPVSTAARPRLVRPDGSSAF